MITIITIVCAVLFLAVFLYLFSELLMALATLTKAIKSIRLGDYDIDLEKVRLPIFIQVCVELKNLASSLEEHFVSKTELSRQIRERQLVEKNLLQSRTLMSMMLGSMPVGVLIVGENKIVRQANAHALELLACYNAEELVGKSCACFELPPLIHDNENCVELKLDRQEYFLKTVDGELCPVLLSILGIEIEDELVWMLLFTDISQMRNTQQELIDAYTALKDAQDKLIQTENLALVGKLASAVAHEVKNPLAVIVQGMDYLKSELGERDDLALALNSIDVAVERADKTVRGLLDFANLEKVELQKWNLNNIVESGIELMRLKSFDKDIELKLELAERDIFVEADKFKVEQVLLNLLFNAVDAVGESGELLVKTSITRKDKKARALLEVIDDGPWIDDDVLGKIYEPFFTTRSSEGGTGMGMAIVKHIAELHNGDVMIRNMPEKGVAVSISLPLV